MSDLTDNQVIEYALALMQETNIMRDEAEDNRQITGRYKLPKLGKDLPRDEAIYILSPDVEDEEKKTRATRLGFVTDVSCLAVEKSKRDGTIKAGDKRKADSVEAGGAMFLRKIDPNRELESDVYWRQHIEGPALIIMECGPITSAEPALRFPWSAFSPDLDGAGWLEHKGIPSVAGRRYEQMIGETIQKYSGKDGPGEGGELYLEGGQFNWRKMSDDFSTRSGLPAMTTPGKLGKADMVWLDDGSKIYHVAMGTDEPKWQIGPVRFGPSNTGKGKLVAVYDNPFGRCSMFIASGNKTPQRKTEDRHSAYLRPMIVTTDQENVIDSTRATTARNRAVPRKYAHGDPESTTAYIQANGGKLPEAFYFGADPDLIPFLIAKIEETPMTLDPDLERLDQKLGLRNQSYKNSALAALRDPQVLSSITAAAYVSTSDSAMQDLSGPQTSYDTVRRQMVEAWEHSICYYYGTKTPKLAVFGMTAVGEERAAGKKLGQGKYEEITPKSFEFKHEWRVTSKSRTLAQKQNLYQLAAETLAPLPDGRPGPGLYADLYEALDISDQGERDIDLAVEHALAEFIDPQLVEWAKRAVAAEIEADSGQRIAIAGIDQQQAQNLDQQDNGAPTGGQPQDQRSTLELPGGGNGTGLNPPATNPVESAGGPAVTGG